jgi:hypothetical protein
MDILFKFRHKCKVVYNINQIYFDQKNKGSRFGPPLR